MDGWVPKVYLYQYSFSESLKDFKMLTITESLEM